MVGVYDNVVSQGQTRIPTAITRIIFPDSQSIDLVMRPRIKVGLPGSMTRSTPIGGPSSGTR